MLNLKLFANKTEELLKSYCESLGNALKVMLVSVLNRVQTTELT